MEIFGKQSIHRHADDVSENDSEKRLVIYGLNHVVQTNVKAT